MDNNSDGLEKQTVTQGNSLKGFSAQELADLKLPRYPTTPKGWYSIVKNEGWRVKTEPGKGPGGVRQLFIPPIEVMTLIEAHKHGELPPRKVEGERAAYELSDGTVKLFDQQVEVWAEPVIRLAFIVREKPQFAKVAQIVNSMLLQRVSLLAFRFVFMFCDGDVKRINEWLLDAAKTDGLIKMAYEADCMKRGITPGSNLNPPDGYVDAANKF